MSKTKTPPLSLNKKKEIAKYAVNHPGMKLTQIARFFNCTYNQVIFAMKQYHAGDLNRTKPRAKGEKVEKLMQENNPETMLEAQFHMAIAQVQSDKKMAADTRVALLEKLFNMRKVIQSMKLERHVKKVDSDILAIVVRKFVPHASEDDIIAIYKEALALWKA